MFFIIAYLNGVADSNFPIEDFSNHIVVEDGKLSADTQALEILHHADAWAMILNDDGTVIWEDGLPEELPRSYTATDIAMFSRWYLDDYPVNIWKRSDGLLVIGFVPGSVLNHYISTNTAYVWPLCIGIGIAFIINILLMVYLFVRNAHRVEKSMEPILNGIQSLSQGKEFHLEEKGELAEINAGLNRAGEYLIKKTTPVLNGYGEFPMIFAHRFLLYLVMPVKSKIIPAYLFPRGNRQRLYGKK